MCSDKKENIHGAQNQIIAQFTDPNYKANYDLKIFSNYL